MRVELRTAHLRTRVAAAVTAHRRALGRRSLRVFGRLYLPDCLSKPDSRLHRDLYAMLQPTPEQRGLRLAVAAPRGSAKSTLVSLVYVLWCVCYRTEDYIVLLSDTADKATDFLSQVKVELEANPRLRQDFPDVCEPADRRPPPQRWRKDEVITRNGVKITALGAGQKLRGRKHRQYRPTLLVLDDIENEDNTQTPDAREKLHDWFTKVVLKSGTPETNVILIGTIQHSDALLATLVDRKRRPGWTGCLYRSVIAWSEDHEHWDAWVKLFHYQGEHDGLTGPEAADAYLADHRAAMLADTEVLWPEVEDYPTLMRMRESEGHASFASEKQNEPLDLRDRLFDPATFMYWEDQYSNEDGLLFAMEREYTLKICACDPAMGQRTDTGDYTAIVSILHHLDSRTAFVLDADIARRTPEQTVEAILELHRRRNFDVVVVEVNNFQALLMDEIRRRAHEAGLSLGVYGMTNRTDKMARIQSLQPLIQAGAIRFHRRHRQLLDQLAHFPKGSHDDGPDALEMAVRLPRVPKRYR